MNYAYQSVLHHFGRINRTLLRLSVGAFALGFALLVSATVGVLELPDSFFYVTTGQFLLKGVQAAVLPFNEFLPQTLYGPVYGFLVMLILELPYPAAMMGIPFIQMCLVYASGYLTYRTARLFWPKTVSFGAAAIFFVLPFSFIYATSMMSEVLSQFYFALYIYVFVRAYHGKHRLDPVWLVIISAVMTLTRNSFVTVLLVSGILWLYSELHRIRDAFFDSAQTGYREAAERGIVLFALLAVYIWMQFNHMFLGAYRLTANTGRHLYMGAVSEAKLLPPAQSSVYRTMVRYVGNDARMLQDVGDVALYFGDAFKSGEVTELEVDRLFFEFARDAIFAHPAQWGIHMVKQAFTIPLSAPYNRGMICQLGFGDPEHPGCYVRMCRFSWNPKLCVPFLDTPFFRRIWADYIGISRMAYPFVSTLLLAAAVLGVYVYILAGGIFFRLAALFFLVYSTMLIGTADGRYLLPVYPLYALFIASGVRWLVFSIKQLIIYKRK